MKKSFKDSKSAPNIVGIWVLLGVGVKDFDIFQGEQCLVFSETTVCYYLFGSKNHASEKVFFFPFVR